MTVLDNEREVLPTVALLRKVDNDRFAASRTSWREFLSAEVDPDFSTIPLVVYCFMTGFIDAISFTAVWVWSGFQTGNLAQLGLAAARSIKHGDFLFSLTDEQALLSLVAFNLGAFLGRIGDLPLIGSRTRQWLISGTIAQALLTLIAGVCIHQSGEGGVSHGRGEPAWTTVSAETGLALLATSLGLQGIMAKRLDTHFSTTVVVTAVWVELMVEPKLFNRSSIASRDHKLLALCALFAGAASAWLLVEEIGAPATLGVGAGVKLLVAAAWMFVPEKGSSRGYVSFGGDGPSQDALEVEQNPTYGATSTGQAVGVL